VEVWTHGGERFTLNSFYSLPDAWSYEFTAMSGARGRGLAVLVPNRTPVGGPYYGRSVAVPWRRQFGLLPEVDLRVLRW